MRLLVSLLLLLTAATYCLEQARTEQQQQQQFGTGEVYEIPKPPCGPGRACNNNFEFAQQGAGVFSLSQEMAARSATLGGAANHFGDDLHIVNNALVMGANGSVRHSNSALFAYANRAAMTRRNNEFRVHALNGAVFEATPLRAASLLVRDDESERANATTLAAHLASLSTTATARVAALTAYRYQWASGYSPEDRFRYGFLPSEASLVDGSVAPLVHTIAKEVEPAPLINDTETGVCQLALSGPTEVTSDSVEGGSLDLMSLVTLLAQAVKELDARVAALEP